MTNEMQADDKPASFLKVANAETQGGYNKIKTIIAKALDLEKFANNASLKDILSDL